MFHSQGLTGSAFIEGRGRREGGGVASRLVKTFWLVENFLSEFTESAIERCSTRRYTAKSCFANVFLQFFL